MRRAWCILVLLAATLLLVASAFTDVQAIPLEHYFARAVQESVNAWEKGMMTPPEKHRAEPTGAHGASGIGKLGVTTAPATTSGNDPNSAAAIACLDVWILGAASTGATTWVPGQWVAQGQH